MNKIGISLVSIVIFLSLVTSVFALNIEIDSVDKSTVVIAELGNPAVFDLVINNLEAEDTFEIYTLVGVSMIPKGTFKLPIGETTIEVEAYLSDGLLVNRGHFIFEYQLRGHNVGILRDSLMINIVELKDTVEIFPVKISPGDEELNITIKNMQNINLDNINIKFKSIFFEFEKEFSLKPFETVSFNKDINLDNLNKVKAGHYVLVANLEFGSAKSRIDGIVDYLEKEGTSVYRGNSGFLVRENIVKKTNEGNTVVNAKIDSRRDILTRLFTSYSVEPSITSRAGLFVDYGWEKELEPGESFEVVSKTNYTLPFFLVILVFIIALISKFYTKTALVMKKRVRYVKTKGGELALKINIRLKAKKHLKDIRIADSIPIMTKLYDRFGRKPDKIDKQKRKIYWNIDDLRTGEERIISYIIYSKIKIIGKFEIPAAKAAYEVDGKKEICSSNRTFFVADSAGN